MGVEHSAKMTCRTIPMLADSGQSGPPPMQPPPRVGAPLPGRRQSSNSSNSCLIAGIIGAAVAIFMVFAIGILAAIMLPALARAREAARRASCMNNLKQMGIVYKMWAGEHDGEYPPLSNVPGDFCPTPDTIYPEFLTDPAIFVCPSDPTVPDSTDPHVLIGDESYFYLGYAVTNETEARAFIDAYREREASGGSFDQDLEVTPGSGTGGSNAIVRIREGIERDLPVSESQIPVAFDRELSQHIPGGINVLYMDGHVTFLRDGQFPAQQWFLDALAELENF